MKPKGAPAELERRRTPHIRWLISSPIIPSALVRGKRSRQVPI
jgi:hypothetical protein